MLRAAVVFVAMALYDVFWARYVLSASARRSVVAGGWSSAIVVSGAFCTLAYVNDPRMVAPAALGAFVGTWLSVRK